MEAYFDFEQFCESENIASTDLDNFVGFEVFVRVLEHCLALKHEYQRLGLDAFGRLLLLLLADTHGGGPAQRLATFELVHILNVLAVILVFLLF